MDHETPTNPEIHYAPTLGETIGDILGIACFLALCYVVFLFAAAA
jgi:hypothetical protein